MKKWFVEHKKQIILSVIGTLLPMIVGWILWDRLPATMVTHWSVGGGADAVSSKGFAVFGIPAILAALELLGMVFTAIDPKQNGQNKKAMRMIWWIMPLLSWGVCCTMFAVAMKKTADVFLMMPLLMSILFLVIGNYMPKVKQNATLGIKILWTLGNEENWNKTHRLAGKLWVGCGLAMLLTVLLPVKWMVAVLIIACLVMVVIPMIYSYSIYKKHRAQGIVYTTVAAQQGQRKPIAVTVAMVAVTLIGVAVLMFTGDINYTVGEDSLKIKATYEKDIEVLYDQMDAVEYREQFEIGARIWGFGSVRLSMGRFQNEEYSDYTIYAYNSCASMIVIRSGEEYLAINAETAEKTQELYQTLLEKVSP